MTVYLASDLSYQISITSKFEVHLNLKFAHAHWGSIPREIRWPQFLLDGDGWRFFDLRIVLGCRLEFNRIPSFNLQQHQMLAHEVEDLLLKGGIKPTSLTEGFFSPIFTVQGQGMVPSHQPPKTKQIYLNTSVQDGVYCQFEGCEPEGDFIGKLDL